MRFCIWAAAALAAGLALRLWFVRHMALVAGDSLMYGDIAKNLLQHRIYGFTEGGRLPGSIEIRPTLIRLPGYPLFLAACFRLFGMEHYNAVLYMQTAADLVTCALVSAIARRIWGIRAALAVLWLAALCPFTASYAAVALTETLVLNAMAVALFGFARWQDAGCGFNRWLWLVALGLGYSILLRPEQVLFAAAVLGGMLWAAWSRRPHTESPLRAASPAVAAALCVALPLVPWVLRNERTFHLLQPIPPLYANDPGEVPPVGFGRWYRTWAIDFASTESVYWNYSGVPINVRDLPERAFDAGSPAATRDLRARTAALLNDYNATTIYTPDVIPAIDERFAALADERIREHPVLYYVGLPVARTLDMIFRPRTEMTQLPLEWWKPPAKARETAVCAALAALNLAYVVAGAAGFILWRRSRWQAATHPGGYRELAIAMAFSIVLRTALLLKLDNSEPRYTLEFFPVLFVFAGALFAARQPRAAAEPSGAR